MRAFWSHMGWATAGVAALLSSASAGFAADSKELVIVATGGAFEQSLRKNFYDPFSAESGIQIRSVSASNAETWTKVKAMSEAKAISWDIVTAWPEDLVAQAAVLAKIDCTKLTNLAAQAVEGACTDRGLLRTTGGVNIVYDDSKFPAGGPQTWADFWDVKRFPRATLDAERRRALVAADGGADGRRRSARQAVPAGSRPGVQEARRASAVGHHLVAHRRSKHPAGPLRRGS